MTSTTPTATSSSIPPGTSDSAIRIHPICTGSWTRSSRSLLNDGGLQNLDHQGNPNWTLSDALSSISWLVGQNIPGVAST